MKIRFILSGLLCCLLTTSICFSDTTTAADSPRFDFGLINPLDIPVIHHDFKLHNTTGKTLVIDHLKPSCNCVTARLDKALPMFVNSGQVVTIHVSIDALHLSGTFHKFVWVLASETPEPISILELTGRAVEIFRVEPDHLNYGQVSAGRSVAIPLVVHVNPRLLPFGKEPQLISTNPDITLAGRDSSTAPPSAPDKAVNYMATLSPHARAGVITGSIGCLSLALPHKPLSPLSIPQVRSLQTKLNNLRLPLSGEVIGQLKADPAILNFGAISGSDPAVRTLIVTGVAPSTQHAFKALCSAPLSIVKTIATPTGIEVHVQLKPGQASGSFTSEVNFVDGAGNRLVAPVAAFFLPSANPQKQAPDLH